MQIYTITCSYFVVEVSQVLSVFNVALAVVNDTEETIKQKDRTLLY
jgi:hypothetical protein